MSSSKYKGLNEINPNNYSDGIITGKDQHYFSQKEGNWETQFGEVIGIGSEISTIASGLNSNGWTNNSNTSSIVSYIESLGYTVIMTPTYNGMAELMAGQNTTLTSSGRFRYDLFDSGTIQASDGFSNTALNGHPYIAFAGFSGTTFTGVACMMYNQYSGDTPLKNLFNPNQDRTLYAQVVNNLGTVTHETATSGTSTIFSDGQAPGVSGYNATSKFSRDDGSFGFAIGTTRLDGNGGPYLSNNATNAFGCENPNAGDSSADDFYWGGRTVSTNYVFVAFAKFV